MHKLRRRICVAAVLLVAILPVGAVTHASDVLECVPYARQLSGVQIHGDAWTWWDKAKGRYRRGQEPRPGAVLSLASTTVMPLGHVAVVSRILDDRRILLRHANWSGPGVIDQDVLALDVSPDNDWSEVRIWWSPLQQMGARTNPANGFIYPDRAEARAVYAEAATLPIPAASASPRLKLDPRILRLAQQEDGLSYQTSRTLADIIADIRREPRRL